jgi:hypothetical protein
VGVGMWGFCNVWVCVCGGFVMCGCLLIRVLVFNVFCIVCTVLYCLVYVYLFLFVVSVLV